MHLHTGVRFDFTQSIYDVSENVGNAPVAVTITNGTADQPIDITVMSIPDSAIGK